MSLSRFHFFTRWGNAFFRATFMSLANTAERAASKHLSTLLNLLVHLFCHYLRGVSDALFATAQDLACINALYVATDRRAAELLETRND